MATPTTMQLPDGSKPIPIPKRLEPVFKELDKDGMHSLLKGNGQYDMLDAPLPTVARRIHEYTTTKSFGLSTSEAKFLRDKLGIDMGKGTSFTFDIRVMFNWINRWTLSGTKRVGKPQVKKNSIPIKVVYDGKKPFNPQQRNEIEKVLTGTLRDLLSTVNLDPSEMPKVIKIKVGNFGLSMSNAKTNPHDKTFADKCVKLDSIIFGPKQVTPEMEKKARDTGKGLDKLFSKAHLSKNDASVMSISNYFLLEYFTGYFKFLKANPGAKNNPNILTAVVSPLALLMAHELGHLFHELKGNHDYLRRKVKVMRSAMKPGKTWAKSLFEYCAPGLGSEPLLTYREQGKLGQFLKPNTLEKIVRINFDEELDATHIGFYIALSAGYDLAMFSQAFQFHPKQSFRRPSDKDFITWMNWIVKEFGHSP